MVLCEASQRAPQVASGQSLKALLKQRRAVDGITLEKRLKNLRSTAPEDERRDPRVFLPYLSLIFIESRLTRPENRQIDVNDQCAGVAGGRCVVFRCHDQCMDSSPQWFGRSGTQENLLSPLRARLLVVFAPGIVDSVVKPEGELDFCWCAGEMAREVKVRETFEQMLGRVVRTPRFAIPGEKKLKEFCIRAFET